VLNDSLDVLHELLARFGSLLREQHAEIASVLLPLLDDHRAGARKRALHCIGVLRTAQCGVEWCEWCDAACCCVGSPSASASSSLQRTAVCLLVILHTSITHICSAPSAPLTVWPHSVAALAPYLEDAQLDALTQHVLSQLASGSLKQDVSRTYVQVRQGSMRVVNRGYRGAGRGYRGAGRACHSAQALLIAAVASSRKV
jgi:hypothetical protein